ncbi:alpha/beta hydrolase [Granulicella sp. L60]|uniref:alpha/beta hydrolase n=1 Tax=Granulicella sp. L60 TaxID=1641866 RepID=UPI00131BB0B0|nr:alpha/beta fold hydrolase [Granulicella sp. L60]
MPRPTKNPTRRPPPQSHTPEVVSPIWLLKGIALTIFAALICGYLTFCLLFYQGQWQLVLHPTRTSSSPSSIAGIPYELIRFGPDETAIPQLTGWWIPSAPEGRYARATILFLPRSDGSLVNSIPTLASLHNLGINVFAFDYRGYGQSAAARPSQQAMTHDVDSAWQYLTNSRAIPAQQIIPYGTDIGASLATSLAATHPTIPALILDTPRADLLPTAQRDPRSQLIPVRLLFHERFPLLDPLSTLHTPKLLLSRSASPDPGFQTAADPKLTVELPTPSDPIYNQSVSRFLDQYLLQTLVPTPAPAP